MPDLMPDTSVLKPQTPQMSLVDLLNLAKGAQEYQSKQAMTQALQGAYDPNTNQVSSDTATKNFLAAPGWKSPEQISALQTMGSSQLDYHSELMNSALQPMSSLLTKAMTRGGATLDDWAAFKPILQRMGVPRDMLDAVADAATAAGTNRLDPTRLAQINNYLTRNAGLSTVTRTLPSGQTDQPAAGAVLYPQTPGQTAPGLYSTSLPPDAPKSIEAANVSRTNAQNYQQDVFPFEQALKKMEQLKAAGQTIGPGSASRNAAQSWLYSLSPQVAKQLGIDPDKLEAFAMTDKYLTQGMMSRAAGFDAHTDARFASLMAGSPTVHTADLAGIPLVKAQLGIRNMVHTQDYLARLSGDPNFLRESARIGPMMEPVAYGMKYASPDQIKKMQSSVTGDDRTKLNANIAAGVLSGAIPAQTAGLTMEQAQRLVRDYFFSGRQ